MADFEPYREDVYRWAFRILGRHHDAMDVAQDVFLRWLGRGQADPPRRLRPWLRQVTLNRAIDVVRSRGRRREVGPPCDAPSGPRPPGTVEAEELRGLVAVALAELSGMQRSVLVAKVYDGLSFAAIAAEHDLAVPTVKTHYLRGLATVREHLERHWT